VANTQIKAVRDALATVLTDAGHTVFKYGADPAHTGRTFVVFDSPIRAEQEPLTFGNNRVELVTVDLLIFNKAGGRSDTNAAAAETTLEGIVGDIEDDLRGDITVGGVVFNAEPSSSLETEVMADEDGWVFMARMTVDVEAHI